MADYFIGCTHFGHANILKKTDRHKHWATVAEMNTALTDNWNSVVSPKDTVYILGDFCFRGDPPETYEKNLNGIFVRIKGNHDPEDWGVDYKMIKFNKRHIILFHYPIEEWDGWYHGSLHIHSHTHKPELVSAVRRANVGADAINYTPIRMEDIFTRLGVS